MAEAIEFEIVQNMQEALEGIKIVDGYHHNLQGIAVKLDPETDVEAHLGENPVLPFIVIEMLPDIFDHQPSERVMLTSPFVIHAINSTKPVNDLAPKDDDAMMRTFYRLCADVERAIQIDSLRGNKAIDTRILSRTMRDRTGEEVWAMLTGEISQERGYGAPDG